MISFLLTSSAVATGALAGLMAALATSAVLAVATAAGLPAPTAPLTAATATPVVAALVAVGLALDLVALRVGRPLPPTHGGQVPRIWSSLLPPRVVAVLYGARLGVGPLTILSTWTWWAVTLGSALLGPAPAALVGATFGLVRQAATVAASLAAGRDDHARWFGRLRSRRRPGWLVLNGAALVLLAATVAGCTDSAARPRFEAADGSTGPTAPTIVVTDGDHAGDGLGEPTRRPADDPPNSHLDRRPGAEDGLGSSPASTVPAHLEDFVRPSPAAGGAGIDAIPNPRPGVAGPPSTPEALAAALPRELPGYQPVDDDPTADRYLDLPNAADLQPDPTEEVALLETRSYQGGWIRAFRNGENDVAVATVYEFARPEDAEFYLEDGLILIGGYGGRFFDLEGYPGVRGFRQELEHEGEHLVSLGAAFQAGRRWHLLYLLGGPDTVTPDALATAVTAQQRLDSDATAPSHVPNGRVR